MDISKRALELVSQDGIGVASRLCAEFGITRQAANGRLRRMVTAGLLEGSGATRDRVWKLAEMSRVQASYPIAGLSEDIVWRALCAPVVADLPGNEKNIWH